MLDDTLLRTFVTLLVCVGFLACVPWLIRRFAPKRYEKGSAYGMEVLARMPLTPKAMMTVARVGTKVYALGVTEHSVTLITEIEQVQYPPGVSSVTGPALETMADFDDDSFRAFLKSLFARKKDDGIRV